MLKPDLTIKGTDISQFNQYEELGVRGRKFCTPPRVWPVLGQIGAPIPVAPIAVGWRWAGHLAAPCLCLSLPPPQIHQFTVYLKLENEVLCQPLRRVID